MLDGNLYDDDISGSDLDVTCLEGCLANSDCRTAALNKNKHKCKVSDEPHEHQQDSNIWRKISGI